MSSHRDLITARERRAFIENEEKQQREKENRAEYGKYVQSVNAEQERTPLALKSEPLTYEQWAQYLPADEPDPILRGLKATSCSLWKRTMQVSKDKVAAQLLEDGELEVLGFDLSERIDYAFQIDTKVVAEFFRRFMAEEPRFDKDLHLDAITGFLERNRLFPSTDAIARTFTLLLKLNLIEPKPEPAPKPECTNRFGVNLHIEADPELERRKRQEEYRTKIVATDPRTGQTFTEYQLDRLDAETYRRLVIGEHHLPTMRDVLKVQQ